MGASFRLRYAVAPSDVKHPATQIGLPTVPRVTGCRSTIAAFGEPVSDDEDEDTTTAYCVEHDGNIAVAERLWGLTSDGTEIVELVCYAHAPQI